MYSVCEGIKICNKFALHFPTEAGTTTGLINHKRTNHIIVDHINHTNIRETCVVSYILLATVTPNIIVL